MVQFKFNNWNNGTGTRYSLGILHQCSKSIKTKSHKVLLGNSYVCRSYRGKTGRVVFLPPILNRVKKFIPTVISPSGNICGMKLGNAEVLFVFPSSELLSLSLGYFALAFHHVQFGNVGLLITFFFYNNTFTQKVK